MLNEEEPITQNVLKRREISIAKRSSGFFGDLGGFECGSEEMTLRLLIVLAWVRHIECFVYEQPRKNFSLLTVLHVDFLVPFTTIILQLLL